MNEIIIDNKVIALSDGLKFDDELALNLRQQLIKAIDQTKQPVQFLNFLWVLEGWIEINCANKETVEWLLYGIDITISINKINKHKINFHKVEAYHPLTFAVPNYGQKFDSIKLKLEYQNPGLNTSKWRLVKEKIYTNKEKVCVKKFLFEVDPETMECLENVDFKLYFHFGLVELKKFDDTVYKCESKKELSQAALEHDLPSYFSRDELKGKVFLADILKEHILSSWGVKPNKFNYQAFCP